MLLLLLKLLAGLVGGVVLIGILFVAVVFIRKSNAFVLRSDLAQLAASGIGSDLASDICGMKVDSLRGVDGSSPGGFFPKASVVSWRPVFPMEGTVEVRVAGVGYQSIPWDQGGGEKAVTGPCKGTIAFRYRCRWSDNGRAVVLESSFVEPPRLVRGR